jgi:hypothetical protein
MALCWLGRGDYEIDEWNIALTEAADFLDENYNEQLIAIPLVADYLLEGLNMHGYSCEE